MQDSPADSLEGLGVHHMWGFSQAFNVQAMYEANQSTTTNPADEAHTDEPLNILLSNPADIRHVLMTLSQRRRHARRPLHFYILDRPMEVLARHLLLLSIATDWEIPVRQRTNTFLEVFGNTLVQRRTDTYIAQQGKLLETLLCDNIGNETLKSMIDFSLLKYRERDELQAIFKSWSINNPYDAKELHDRRLRILYKDRYDWRKNVIDWDYQWSLKPIGSLIHVRQYRTWRNTGVAFEFGDQQYVRPNRSMSSYAEGKERGLSMMRRGYWCDIVCSPYVAVGIDCATPNEHAEELFDIYNQDSGSEQHRHHTVEIAVHNILSWLYEIETGNVYRMARAHDIYSGLGGEKNKKSKESYRKKREEEEKKEEEEKEEHTEKVMNDTNDFVPASTFVGAKEDYDFKTADQGTGYYKRLAKATDEMSTAVAAENKPFPDSMEKFTKVSVSRTGEVDSDDDPITDDEEEGGGATLGDVDIEIVDDNVNENQKKTEDVVVVVPKEEIPEEEEEEEEEPMDSEELEKAHARALKRAANIMEVLSDVKVFVVGQTLTQILDRPKKKFTNLFDVGFLSNKDAHLMRDSRLPYLFKRQNAVLSVETAKYVVPLEKKTKQLFVKRVEQMATKDMKATKGTTQPVFWNRAWSKKSAAERREKKKEKEQQEERKKNMAEGGESASGGESKTEEKKVEEATPNALDVIPSVITYVLPDLKA